MTTAAVIGCGDVSIVHFDALASLSDVQLVAVCDTDPERLAAAAAAYQVPGYVEHLALLAEARPDVVHICTPHNQHAAVAVDCLERGVHVILEKPLAHTIAEAQRLVEVADRCSAKIGVCLQNRYNLPVQAMHRLLSSGEVGRVLGGAATVLWHRTAEYYLSRTWRGTWQGSGGGVLMNQAIHTVDLLQSSRRYMPTDLLRGWPARNRFGTEGAVRGRAYWGLSHQVLIQDFYGRLDEDEPFWISPREAEKSLRIIKRVYQQTYPRDIRYA